jgi:hypothetical protein
MAAAWTVSNRKDGTVEAIPNILNISQQGALTNSWSGAFRAVRCRIVGSGTYAAGGTALPDVGLKDIQAVIMVGEAQAAAQAGSLYLDPVTKNLKINAPAGGELGAVSAVGTWEVVVLGRSG